MFNKSNIILHIDNLTISNIEKKNTLLHSVSFKIYESEFISMVGESGSGKSIICLTILSLLRSSNLKIDSGQIWYYKNNEKIPLLNLNEKEIRKIRLNEISIIFQSPLNSLNPKIKCGEQILEGVKYNLGLNNKFSKIKTHSLLKSVDFSDTERIYNSYPHQLSGGQLQRIIIAIALSCNPRILIADEPTTSLDNITQSEIICLFKKIQKKYKLTCLFVSHDLSIVEKISKRIIVIFKGKILEKNTTKNLFQNPLNIYTKALLLIKESYKFNLIKYLTKENVLEKKFNFSLFRKENVLEKTILIKNRNRIYENKPIIKLTNVSKKYLIKRFFRSDIVHTALLNINLKIFKGECFGIIGKSGSGKSTIVKCILNLEKITSGKITKSKLNSRRDIQIIFQNTKSSLNPSQRIDIMIMEIIKYYKLESNNIKMKKYLNNLLSDVGLEKEILERYPHQLSGGEIQRVAIAKAIAVKPKVIIFDESISGLDLSLQGQILNLLNFLKNKYNLTFIFISHNLNIVKSFCDRISVISEGELVKVGFAEDILKSNVDDIKKLFVKNLNR